MNHTILLGFFGGQEIIIVLIIVVLLFGAKKIPQLMRGMGSGIKEFKEGMKEGDDEQSSENTEDKALK